jgi:hypothetical protein
MVLFTLLEILFRSCAWVNVIDVRMRAVRAIIFFITKSFVVDGLMKAQISLSNAGAAIASICGLPHPLPFSTGGEG